jgi:hypothetical protein
MVRGGNVCRFKFKELPLTSRQKRLAHDVSRDSELCSAAGLSDCRSWTDTRQHGLSKAGRAGIPTHLEEVPRFSRRSWSPR